MKKVFILIAVSFLLNSSINAQAAAGSGAGDAIMGQVVLPDNSTVSGTIKESIRKKGELTVITGDKKTKYKAGDISSAQIGSSQYITWNYTFYEVLGQNKNLTLLRKANEPAGVQYNGSDAVTVNSEGNIDDLFIKKNGETSLQIVTKKNIKEVLSKICPTCAGNIDVTKFDTEAVKKAVTDCDNCK